MTPSIHVLKISNGHVLGVEKIRGPSLPILHVVEYTHLSYLIVMLQRSLVIIARAESAPLYVGGLLTARRNAHARFSLPY